jgi:Ser/Thr protein kinase RdoA (MazF antagonist)
MSGSTVQVPVLTLLGRTGCHLCEDMRAALGQCTARFHFSLEEVDITGQPELEARYRWDIPVLMAGASEICRHYLDERALQTWLAGRDS